MKKIYLFFGLFLISFFPQAQTTYVPDDNFEQALIDLGYDDVLDDYVLTANIVDVLNLDVRHKSISDLTGIEDFSNLIDLKCSFNNLSFLDVSRNASLNLLFCKYNQLTNLNISNNTFLRYLSCTNNPLENLDITNNNKLITLDCQENGLNSLDVSQHPWLEYLVCRNNNIFGIGIR